MYSKYMGGLKKYPPKMMTLFMNSPLRGGRALACYYFHRAVAKSHKRVDVDVHFFVGVDVNIIVDVDVAVVRKVGGWRRECGCRIR